MDTTDTIFLFLVFVLFGTGCFFGGFETSRIVHNMDKEILALEQNKRLQACHSLLVGELYAKGE